MPASILAEPRRKQKISIDPQNQTWKKDSEKFGHKLMEKMGWKDGKGLGSKEQGITDNIRLQPNYTARGLGSEPINHDKTWMAHHDDFAQILAQLNKDKPAETNKDAKPTDMFSIESKSKQSKSRIHYHRFTRGKDLSRLCDNQQKSAILGGNVSKEKAADCSSTDNKRADQLQASNTTVSKMSMSDYFAAKMKHKLDNKNDGACSETISQPASDSDQKREEELVMPADDEAEVLSKIERRKRKEARKLEKKKRKLEMAAEEQESKKRKSEHSD